MRHSRKRGATLSLVAVVVLVIIVIGLCVFFLARIVGGARELQNAVDAGNLNVAKTALRSPDIKIFASSGSLDLSGSALASAQENFRPNVDPATGEIDLLTFNKCVGQALLVSMNAAGDQDPSSGKPNPQGLANAKALLDLIYNPGNGIGTILATKLKTDSAVDNNFLNVAALFPMRMLKVGTSAGTISIDKDTSFMVPDTATNIKLDAAALEEIPQEFTSLEPSFISSNTTTSLGTTYFSGYQFFDITGVTDNSLYPLMGVPMRPGQKPHLVSQKIFTQLKPSPLACSAPGASRVPPNSFYSKGWANEIKSSQALNTLSCAIIGTVGLTGEYRPAIPCGYIVVANGPQGSGGPTSFGPNAAGATGTVLSGTQGDVFTDVLMHNVIYVTSNGAMAKDPNAITDIQAWKQAQAAAGNPTSPVPAALANALDGPSPKQAYADGIPVGETPASCDNHTSAMGTGVTNSICVANLASMASVYGSNMPSGSDSTTASGMMAVEAEKSAIITPRPAGEMAIGLGQYMCTGMKTFPMAGIPGTDPTVFGGSPNVLGLIQDFTSYGTTSAKATLIYNQIATKIKQMRPGTSDSDIKSFLAGNVAPMGQLRFIWVDLSGNLKFTDAGTLPPWINTSAISPDGSPVVADTSQIGLDGTFVDLVGEQGFPHPWDCVGYPPPWMDNSMIFQRSSGYNCLQGILRFQNCVNDNGGGGGGTQWTCPC